MSTAKNKASPKAKDKAKAKPPYVSQVDDTIETIKTIEEPITDQSTDQTINPLINQTIKNKSIMNFPSFSKAMLVKSGQRVTTNEAQVVCGTTLNHFILSNKAMKLLGVEKGDNVQFVDALGDAACIQYDADGVQIPMELGKRFYILKGDSAQGQGAKIDGKGAFSYSGIWGAMIINNGVDQAATGKDVVAAGKGVAVQGKNSVSYIATQKTTFEMKPVLDEEGVAVAMEGNPIFALVNPKTEASTPKVDEDKIID